MLLLILSFIPLQSVDAAPKYKDGEYSLPVVVYKTGTNERSVTNDYIVSPAKLIVKNGQNYVQLTQKNASWWKSFSVDTGAVTTISEGNDTRVVQFPVPDLTKPVNAHLHVVVPDINYDNKYQVRFSFDASGIPTASVGDSEAPSDRGQSGGSVGSGSDKVVENPKTSDDSPIVLFVLLLLGSGFFLVRRLALTQ